MRINPGFFRRDRGDDAAAYLSRQARNARDVIRPFSADAVATLQAEAATLPEQFELFGEVLHGARGHDTPETRVAVARALLALREGGMVDEHVVAAAMLELVNGRSPITEAAISASRTA